MTAEQMAAIAGLYWNREDDDFEKVQVKDGKLQIHWRDLAVSSPQERRISTWLTFPWATKWIYILSQPLPKSRATWSRAFGGGEPDYFESVSEYAPHRNGVRDLRVLTSAKSTPSTEWSFRTAT